MNFETARYNMVEQQVRPWNVLDQTVLSLMNACPREDFVPTLYRKLAYADTSIPLLEEETMLPPREVGRMLQAVQVTKDDLVLEVGSGSGYITALLADLAAEVISVEINESIYKLAQSNLKKLDLKNINLIHGNASDGWPNNSPYNVICLSGAVKVVPEALLSQLQVGGRLFAYVGKSPVMEAKLITRISENDFREQSLYETVVPELTNVTSTSTFKFE